MMMPLYDFGQCKQSGEAVYVHYGCTAREFTPERFEEIRNQPFFTKSSGGLWASPAQAPFGWVDFCRREGYEPRSGLDKRFFFSLHVDARVFQITSREDFDLLPKCNLAKDFLDTEVLLIDFEMCRRRGIDAIEYHYSAVHREKALGDEMDRMLPGWDCDSILILNPQIIQPFFE